jgi:hypothetical protein
LCSGPALRQLIHKTRKQSAAGSDQLVAASTDWEYQTASSQVFTHLLPLHKRTDFFLPSPLLPILPPSQSVLSSGNDNLQLGLAASRPRASCTAPVLLQFSLQCSAHLLSPPQHHSGVTSAQPHGRVTLLTSCPRHSSTRPWHMVRQHVLPAPHLLSPPLLSTTPARPRHMVRQHVLPAPALFSLVLFTTQI